MTIEKKVKCSIKIDFERCKGCELCAVACKNDCIGKSKGSNAVGNFPAETKEDYEDYCTACTDCAVVCPDACIEVHKYKRK